MKKFILVTAIILGIFSCKKEKTAGFTVNPFKPTSNMPTTFSSNSKIGASYNWDFGDKAVATGQKVTHSFQVKGFYTVQLVVDGEKTFQVITVE